jgi:hypothetical protein
MLAKMFFKVSSSSPIFSVVCNLLCDVLPALPSIHCESLWQRILNLEGEKGANVSSKSNIHPDPEERSKPNDPKQI